MLDRWDTAFDSQARALLMGARESARLMPDGGRIVPVTYATGNRTGGLQPWVAMGSAKAAVEWAVRYVAVALARHGITVTRVIRRAYLALHACHHARPVPRLPRTDRAAQLGSRHCEHGCDGLLETQRLAILPGTREEVARQVLARVGDVALVIGHLCPWQ